MLTPIVIILIIASLIAILLSFVSFRILKNIYDFTRNKESDVDTKLNLRLEIGKASMTASGGLLILAGLIVTIDQQIDGQKQFNVNLNRFEQQINERKENQKIDRFDKGIELLSVEGKASRIGGILILENLAVNDNEKYHKSCVEILTGFINSNTASESYKKIKSSQGIWPPPEIVSAIIALNNLDAISIAPEYKYRIHDLNNCYLPNTKFSIYEKLRLAFFNFRASNFSNSDFTFVELDSCDFNSTTLVGSKFENSKIRSCNFENAKLSNSNFINSKIADSNFKGCDFSNSILSLSDFTNSSLENANLSNCRMLRVNLEKVNIRGANLEGAIDMTQSDLDKAKGNKQTVIPSYLKYPTSWEKK